MVLGLVGRGVDGGLAFGATFGWADDEAVRAYQAELLAERQATGLGRPLSTAGLDRAVHDRALDLVDAELAGLGRTLGRPATFGWLGISSELSPAALHVGLHERQGSPERLRRDAHPVRPDGNPKLVLSFFGEDPGWNDDQLFGWAGSFDVVLTTDPPDLKGRGAREFVRAYQNRLRDSGRVTAVELGRLEVAKGLGAQEVGLYALRKP